MAAAVSGRARGFVISAKRECRFLRASPWDLALATWLPCVCLATLAWLLSSGVVRGLPIAIVDDDRSATSRELTRLLDATPALAVTARPRTLADAWPLVRAAHEYEVIYVPAGTSRDVARGQSATIFAYFDATHPTAGQAAFRDASGAVQEMGVRLAQREIARARGVSAVRSSPILVQASTASNPTPSYEGYLLGLLFPAIVLFALCLSVTGALGRELRDGSAAEWLHACGDEMIPAITGKMAPYLALAFVEGGAGLVWIAALRGDGVHGSAAMLLLGLFALFAAYAAFALLFVGATRSMGEALSLANLFAGTALAYSGGTFPIDGAPRFAAIWNRIVPFASYVKLQSAQLSAGASALASIDTLLALSLFVLVPGVIGLRLFGRAAYDPASWGRR
jgi:ABC-2 type transport system permease protein